MSDNSIGFPLSDAVRIRSALRAAKAAKAIAATQEFDEDAVRLLLERVESELEKASVAADLSPPVGFRKAA